MASTLFAYTTYLAFVACCVFCWRERKAFGSRHAILQFVVLVVFCVLFWLLESWAGMRAPFYDYTNDVEWPHHLPRVDFTWVAASLGDGWLGSFFNPGPAAVDPCAYHTLESKLPLAIPVGGGTIAFSLIWTTRLLIGRDEFLFDRCSPVLATLIVGLMALWLDAALDPVLATTVDCSSSKNLHHPGMSFWTWQSESHLADYWFHVPAYNYGTWFSSPGILAALVMLGQRVLYRNEPVLRGQDAFSRFGLPVLVLILIACILFISPQYANKPWIIYLVIGGLVVAGFVGLYLKWHSFKRDNSWRVELVLVLTLYFLVPVVFLVNGPFAIASHFWLLLLTLFVAGWGIFFAISPYWQLRQNVPPLPILVGILGTVYLLGRVANG